MTITPKTGEAPLLVYCISSVSFPDSQIQWYLWNFNDGTTSSEQNPVHRFEQPGEYTITLSVTDIRSKTYTKQEKISVQPPCNIPPTPEAYADKNEGPAPLMIAFTGKATDPDGTIIRYFWDFGDGTTSSEQNPTHHFQNPGIYTVVFSITDNDHQTRSTTLLISVEETIQEFVPASFVPWIVKTIGRIQLNNHDLSESNGIYDIMINRAESTQAIIEQALDDINTFQLPETYQELKQEVRACLESFKQYVYHIRKGAFSMIHRQYADAEYYFELAQIYKNTATESILRISEIIE